jgi:hypothetical protein
MQHGRFKTQHSHHGSREIDNLDSRDHWAAVPTVLDQTDDGDNHRISPDESRNRSWRRLSFQDSFEVPSNMMRSANYAFNGKSRRKFGIYDLNYIVRRLLK